jgi:Rieske Fe-S protein
VTHPLKDSAATRRGVLAGAGLVGLAGAISACGASSASSLSVGAGAAGAGGAATAGGTGPADSAPGAGASGAGTSGTGGALASKSQIPVGSGMIFTARQVVVTQPSAGEYKAFSAVCTHMGCLVNQISDGTEYSIATGAVVRGPAPRPLPAKKIMITGDDIFLE